VVQEPSSELGESSPSLLACGRTLATHLLPLLSWKTSPDLGTGIPNRTLGWVCEGVAELAGPPSCPHSSLPSSTASGMPGSTEGPGPGSSLRASLRASVTVARVRVAMYKLMLGRLVELSLGMEL
jgi:hypothetical protein